MIGLFPEISGAGAQKKVELSVKSAKISLSRTVDLLNYANIGLIIEIIGRFEDLRNWVTICDPIIGNIYTQA